MLYGYFVSNDPAEARRHSRTTQSPCFSYWDDDALDRPALERMLRATPDHCVAFSSASVNGTSVQDVRAALEQLTNSKRAAPGWSAPPLASVETVGHAG